MKIAMLSPYYGIVNRGAEQFAGKIKKSFESKGHTVDIYSIYNTFYHKLWEDKITNSTIGSFFKKYIGFEPSISQFKYCKNLPIIEMKEYDLLWSNAEYFSAYHCSYIRDLYDIPFIITSHANKSALLKSFAKLKPNMLAVLTPDQIMFLGDADVYIKCIPAGVDTNKFKPKEKDKSGEPRFLSTASLFPDKRIHLIINAISKLDKGHFVFTSDGPKRFKLIELARKKLGLTRYTYLGSVDRTVLPDVYNTCDYYVNASRSEGLSMSIFEAMACNLPVIYQDDVDRRWQVGNGGLGTDTTDIDKFKTILCKAMHLNFDDCPRKQAERYSWDNTVKVYEQEIKRILK